jgi:hypothetical protein
MNTELLVKAMRLPDRPSDGVGQRLLEGGETHRLVARCRRVESRWRVRVVPGAFGLGISGIDRP